MIRPLFLFLFIVLSFSVVNAQSNSGLVRYFSFDNCDGVDNGSAGINAILQNGPQCGCGVSGNGLEFDGIDDAVIIPGTESTFNTVDFSVSFFYKSESGASQDILSRKEFCDNNNAFSIRAVPGSNTIITQMMENSSKGTLWNTPLDQSNCWHHVVFIRDGDFHLLYLDGVLVEEQTTVTRTDISNPNIQLEISGGACLGIQDLGFKGTIDELRIYNRALRDFEIEDLGLSIDEIITPDTLIFLGNSVDILSSTSCATGFSWFPTDGVDIDSDPNTTITPSQTTVYNLQYVQGTCISTDSIRISVIDPSTLDCTELFMANAFTPNGDSRNDAFGISNPFAIEEFVSFEILDKWGNRVFFNDTDVNARWNGVFKGSSALPGVYLYRVLWKCGDEEQVFTGSVTLIR